VLIMPLLLLLFLLLTLLLFLLDLGKSAPTSVCLEPLVVWNRRQLVDMLTGPAWTYALKHTPPGIVHLSSHAGIPMPVPPHTPSILVIPRPPSRKHDPARVHILGVMHLEGCRAPLILPKLLLLPRRPVINGGIDYAVLLRVADAVLQLADRPHCVLEHTGISGRTRRGESLVTDVKCRIH
jgi:hypothetical protein